MDTCFGRIIRNGALSPIIKGNDYSFANLPAGKYWIHVVWDVAEPFLGDPREAFEKITVAGDHSYENPAQVISALKGDYTGKRSFPPIELKNGEDISGIDVECTKLKKW